MAPTTKEPFGTTPLPVQQSSSPVQLTIDADVLLETAQQPQTQQIAVFEATPNEECINGAALSVNQHFVVYAVKKGLIRVLHRHSTLRSLLRGHTGQTVTDIQFFQDGDVLATAGSAEDGSNQSKVFIWRIFERSPEIMSEKLLEIETSKFNIDRIVWHPFNPNQFWMIHGDAAKKTVATLVETTRITTVYKTESHAVCSFFTDFIVMDGAVQLSTSAAGGNLTDLCWSQHDTRHVLTVHDSGDILLWDLKKMDAAEDGTVSPACLTTIRNQGRLTRCLFLPHENIVGADEAAVTSSWTPCFVTASDKNSVLTLWSPFGENVVPTRVQICCLEHPAPSYIVQVVFGPAPADASPPSCFIVLADRSAGKIFAFHCRAVWNEQEGRNKRALLTGCDYVVPFRTKYPTYSWSVVCAPTTDITEEELSEQGGLIFDIKLFAYQSAVVQSLTLTSYMCLPPEHTWTDPTTGVHVERLLEVHSAHVSDVASDDGVDDFEEYELDDDDDEFEAPEPSALPAPSGLLSPERGPVEAPPVSNPFANWLGAIASKATGGDPAPPPVPQAETPMPPPPAPEAPAAKSFLSPKDFVNEAPAVLKPFVPPVPVPVPPKTVSRAPTPTTTNVRAAAAPMPNLPAAPNSLPASQADIASEIRLAVKAEMQATVLPLLKILVEESLAKSVTNPIQISIGKLGEKGVTVDNDQLAGVLSESIQEPLRAAFADSMRSVLIPSLESITGQVLAQVSDRLEKGMPANNGKTDKTIEAMATQMAALTTLVGTLTTEVQNLRASMASQKSVAPPPPQALPLVAAEDTRSEVLGMLKNKKYETAFTKAVSASTADMAVFCCANANLNEVLGGTAPVLSQPILLCLMQQLGTVLASSNNSNLQTELEWLQEIALSLNPADESIKRHVPTVLQQLVASINARMNQGDQTLRRSLQRLLQVVRGMQMG